MKKADGRMADCLMQLGAGRVEAILLACLVTHSPLATKAVVARTGLRQPEVSVGMRTLRERRWVESSPIPREGKGRPMHCYRMAVPNDVVFAHYAEHAKQQIAATQAALADFAGMLPMEASHVEAVGGRDEGSVAHA